MGFTTTIDLGPIAHGLSLPLASVETVVRLLDAGNTVPFITRYRKDQTGGLDEEQIRGIEGQVNKLRMLAERKQTILRSIDSQGKLTPDLAKSISEAESTKRLEDLYLPFKPKKQTLATLARERQLEPLAAEVLSGAESALDLDARARDFINSDKQVNTVADALLGVGHILAEDFAERADLRERLRKIIRRTGKLVSARIETEEKAKAAGPVVGAPAAKEETAPPEAAVPTSDSPAATPLAETTVAPDSAIEAFHPITSEAGELDPAAIENSGAEANGSTGDVGQESVTSDARTVETELVGDTAASDSMEEASQEGIETTPLADGVLPEGDETTATEPGAGEQQETITETTKSAESSKAQPAGRPAPQKPALSRKEALKREKEARKARLEDKLVHEFRDYFNYQEQLGRVPPHRVLAINRGERARILRVKVDMDTAEIGRVAEELLVPRDHPHGDFLRGCVRDALARLVIPSLEREVRRELTENAETHAVEVFAKNLRNLLLQPPVRNRRLVAIDPGFKSGCKVAVLDEFGNLLDHTVIQIIGKAERRQEGRAKLVELIRKHAATVLAVGNGTACRETEELVAELVGEELKDDGVAYVIVNEAGASVYSTSPLGREELPQYDATLRGAISIGRRLQDPLSELVKIDPASIGVGLYQHDVKAKHLRASLDAVVESCVNYVGVDLNTASPALLRYVSGLNQLTARRLYDHRTQNGPFKNREQLKEVPGFGEATFVQAAGFLKITDGDHELDVTWIHPESYDAARKVLARLNRSESDLAKKETAVELGEQVKTLDVKALSEELQVGQLTLADIVSQFTRPGRDPREDLPEPIFKRGILKLDDLQQGMELSGSVLNVVDFGAFVDIGLHDSGLVHVSQLANRYVRDPHEVVSVGDVVKVWVLEIDKTRRRVSLTMIPPGTKKPEPPWKRAKDRRAAERATGGAATAGAGQSPGGGPPGAEPRGERPPRHGGDRRDRGPRREGGPPQHGRPPRPAPAGAGGGPQGSQQSGEGLTGGQRPPSGQGAMRGGPPRGGQQRGGFSGGGGRRGAPPPHMRGYSRPQRPPSGGEFRPKGPPKPPPKLTKKMIEGKEPMRTFGDLAQFMKIKDGGEPPAEQEKKPKQSTPPAATLPAEQTSSAAPAETSEQATTALPPVAAPARIEPASGAVPPPSGPMASEAPPPVASPAPATSEATGT
jgi:transcriptional accessory protein Tex/SPT6